jgi:transcription termination factor Rho
MTIAELKEKNITELSRIARTLEIPGASGFRKQHLIFRILQTQSEKEGRITTICPAPTTSMFPRRRFANST